MVDVELRVLDGAGLADVVAAAADGADPLEVMPPMDGPPGWTPARRAAYARFLAARLTVETCWVVVVDGRTGGVARLSPGPGTGEMETGLWLTRRLRGRGVGAAVLAELVQRARAAGARRLVADTTTANRAAVRALAGVGARLTSESSGTVSAVLDLAPDPPGGGLPGPRPPPACRG